jgi:hypothetical protein
LSVVAGTGKPFKAQLSFLAVAASKNPLMAKPLSVLAEIAPIGAPSDESLQREYKGLMPKLEEALRRADATTWWQRVLIELRGLVSVHSLTGPDTEVEALTGISSDLERHKLAEAMEKTAVLPDNTKSLLADWRAKAERRQKLDAAIDSVAEILSQDKPDEGAAE